MKNSLYNVLSTLDKKELRKFGDFLKSPYFNKSGKLLKLFCEIRKHHPVYKGDSLSPEALSSKLFPGVHFNASTMRDMFSDLHRLSLKFITQQYYEENQADSYKYLFTQLTRKKLNTEFTKSISLAESHIGSEGTIGYNYFYNKFIVETFKYNFMERNGDMNKPEKMKQGVEYLNNSGEYLTKYYFRTLIAVYMVLKHYDKYYNIDLKSQLLDKIVNSFDMDKLNSIFEKNTQQPNEFNLYFMQYEAYNDLNDNSKYFRYKDYVMKHFDKFDHDEKCFHHYRLISYCEEKTTAGAGSQKVFLDELLSLYEENIKKELYKDSFTQFFPWDWFRAHVFNGIRFNKYKWVERFIKQYHNKLHPDFRKNAYNLELARLNFHMGNYGKALVLLNSVSQSKWIYKHDVRMLTLKIFYEQGYYSETTDSIKSYLITLKNDKLLTHERLQKYRNFAKYLNHIVLLKSGSRRLEADQIMDKLNAEQNTFEKPWLKEKLNGILE